MEDLLVSQGGPPTPSGTTRHSRWTSTLHRGVQVSNALPRGDDYEFMETYGSFRSAMKGGGTRLLAQLASTVALLDGDADAGAPAADAVMAQRIALGRGLLASLRKAHDLKDVRGAARADRFGAVSDALDVALEGVDRSLRRHARGETSGAGVGGAAAAEWNRRGSRAAKPQDSFATAPDNSRAAWKPIITSKPHAVRALSAPLRRLRSDSTYERTEAHIGLDLGEFFCSSV